MIVFLSRESYKGPLNANIPWSHLLENIPLKFQGRIENSAYLFDGLDLVIDCAVTPAWSALDHWNYSSFSLSFPARDRLINFLEMLRKISENELISGVLSVLDPATSPIDVSSDPVSLEIQHLSAALSEANRNAVIQSARYFAGRGRGLTPSGDDFLLGIVYGLFSFQHRLRPAQVDLIAPIIEMVNHRSTLISANLIDCAASGEVDERIGAAFHALLNPDQPLEQPVRELSTWGSSSGMDAAAGFCIFQGNI